MVPLLPDSTGDIQVIMKLDKREVGISALIIVTVLFIVGSFISRIQEKQAALQIDLYALAGKNNHALLTINRPDEFARSFLSQPSRYQLFATYIPEIFLSIISENRLSAPLLIAFHSHQEAVLYMRADKKQGQTIFQTTMSRQYGPYTPLHQEKNGTIFYFLSDSGNRFFGYFQQEGIWVASYSRKLLEESAERLRKLKTAVSVEPKNAPKQRKSSQAPLSIEIEAEALRLSVRQTDSTLYKIPNCRIIADLHSESDRIYYFSQLPYAADADTLYTRIGDTLALRIEHFFPEYRIFNQTTVKGPEVLFSGYGIIQSEAGNSIVKPS